MSSDLFVPLTTAEMQQERALRWEALWDHRDDLMRIATRRCPSPTDAPDVVQETIIRAASKADLRLPEAGAWMTRTLVNLCADLHRRPQHVDLDLLGDLPSPRVDCQSPEAQVSARSDVESILRRFPGLPPRQQQAVRLKAQELGVAEVAEQMQLPYKTVESLLSRARRHLRVGLAFVGGVCGFGAAKRIVALGSAGTPAVTAAAVGGLLAVAAPGAEVWSDRLSDTAQAVTRAGRAPVAPLSVRADAGAHRDNNRGTAPAASSRLRAPSGSAGPRFGMTSVRVAPSAAPLVTRGVPAAAAVHSGAAAAPSPPPLVAPVPADVSAERPTPQ
jgi:RNA polymerase sigma factor (sigma-70 family)